MVKKALLVCTLLAIGGITGCASAEPVRNVEFADAVALAEAIPDCENPTDRQLSEGEVTVMTSGSECVINGYAVTFGHGFNAANIKRFEDQSMIPGMPEGYVGIGKDWSAIVDVDASVSEQKAIVDAIVKAAGGRNVHFGA